ncbi:protein crumbs homolog 1 [Hypomesus transpacificus]|uniref:protein crumbs homolog 1 n=1 Tax=Hypomesus transpacificus TaxID=137520 RepID=UPI001F07D7F7|nr:protein crumbs homolog 1 [Hypomesus transpacificus]
MFPGATCELEIDECQSQPCLNGGSCRDYINSFTCSCRPGFQGDRCEIDVDDCREQPCQNGAVCTDAINKYSCDCSQTAFMGQHCEIPAPPCRSQPCLNSATCVENKDNYTCRCWPGFKGRECEVDVSECASAPCLHGGRCIERSWQLLYGVEPLLPASYDPRHATGFLCSCQSGTTGTLCQEITQQCEDSPCQNAGLCVSRVGGYGCICPPGGPEGPHYGGQNCSELLVGCEGHECQNQASCEPFFTDGIHGYSCSCPPGFIGPLCQTPTAFSFERRGHLLLQSPLVAAEASCNISLSFRTAVPSAVLFQRGSEGLLLGLEVKEGRLRLSLQREASAGAGSEGPGQALEVPHNVTDGEWHSLEAVLADGVLWLTLRGAEGCEREACRVEAPVEDSLVGLEEPESPPHYTIIGGVWEGRSRAAARPPAQAFIGCLRDVFVDSQLVVPDQWLSNYAVNVTLGCSHRDRCLVNPCQNQAQCINLWQGYQCRCPRPYKGQDCAEEYVTGRFGHEDLQSYAEFTVTDNPGHDITVSFFLRTRSPNALLLVLANSTSQYLRAWLQEGRLVIQLNGLESVRGDAEVVDGEVRFVSVAVENGSMSLDVGNRRQGEAGVRPLGVQAGDRVYVGGLPQQAGSLEFGGYLKGCLQDLRINHARLQFFGLDDAPVMSYNAERLANVTPGCPGDDSCRRKPCQNGGVCYSVWDDFSCTCAPSTAGRRCEEVRWCELSPCPPYAECSQLSQGYECLSNATFLDDSSVLYYRGNGRISRNLTSMSLSVRTRKHHAAVLHAERGPEFLTVSVQDGFLSLELQTGPAPTGPAPVSLSSGHQVSDGEWHSAHLFMTSPWDEASRWSLVLDENTEDVSTSVAPGGNLNFLRDGVDILVGGLGLEAGWSWEGCLGPLEVGGIVLSYLSPAEVNLPRTQDEQFVRISSTPPRSGCGGAPVCRPDPCLHGAVCSDLFNLFSCSCSEGWAGQRCEVLIDTCASGPCIHGTCSVTGLGYECACEPGYRGAQCDEEVDMCEEHRCAHGGTCLHGVERYACLCPENYTGPYCRDRVEEVPWYIVVKTLKPRLPVSVCGDENRNYTCFNGGNCTDIELSCDCPPGYSGHR